MDYSQLKKSLIIILGAFSLSALGKVSYRGIEGKRHFHSYKEVCKHYGYKDLILAGADGMAKVDCMAKKVLIRDFCLAKYKDRKDFLRGRVDKIGDQVMCEFGSGARVSISCVGKGEKYCAAPKKSCSKLKKIYAYKHDLVRSVVNNLKLNCSYSMPVVINSIELK